MKMSYRKKAWVAVGLCAGLLWWWYAKLPEPTVLVVRLDQTFEEVVKNSTYPVLEAANLPSDDPSGDRFGVIWVTKPAVIIKYDDPVNGFVLPPTKFAGIPFSENRLQSIETSPMLKALPYDETIEILRSLQDQFKARGWEPWTAKGQETESQWFDLSEQGKKKLYDEMYATSGARSIEIGVPRKNLEVMLRIKCQIDCEDDAKHKARFLVDVGVGPKSLYYWDGR